MEHQLTSQTKAVADAIEHKDFTKAMSMRDSEFKEMLQAFEISSSLNVKDHVPEDKVRIRLCRLDYACRRADL